MINKKVTIGTFFFVVLLVSMGCQDKSEKFVMTVDRVDVLNGFILKGISISGTITEGCIANDDSYIVKRGRKQVTENSVRLLSVFKGTQSKPFNGEAAKGETATFYIPDGKKEEVEIGDVVSSKISSCKIIESIKNNQEK